MPTDETGITRQFVGRLAHGRPVVVRLAHGRLALGRDGPLVGRAAVGRDQRKVVDLEAGT